MSRLVSTLVLVAFLLSGGVVPAYAEKPVPQTIQWNVHWGWQVWPNWWGTSRFLKADPATRIITHIYYGNWFASSVEQLVDVNGVQGISAAFNHIYRATAFQLQFPGASHSFAGMNWNPSCLPGPNIEFNISPDQRITVINTTGRSLWLFNQNSTDDGREIKAGETVIRKAGGQHNGLQLQMTPGRESWNTCVSIFWWLDKS